MIQNPNKMKPTKNSQEFIKNVLKKWGSIFEGIKLKYAYDEDSEYHIIEVEPESIRRGDEDYMAKELQLVMDFADAFDENILICNPSDANNMSNILFSNK